MRTAATVGVLIGMALVACIVVLSIPSPLYIASGLLLGLAPRALRRKRVPRWQVRVRTGPLIPDNDRSKEYIGVYVECYKDGEKPVWIGGYDVRADDHVDKIATAIAKADDRAAYLNAVVS